MSHELYRHFDADGVLLYVGISSDAVKRYSAHSDKPWRKDVVKMTIERHSSREQLRHAERIAVFWEKPKHNKQTPRVHKERNLHIQRAIKYCGSQAKLAQHMGGRTRQGHIHQWLNCIKPVSPESAALIERATDGHVTRLQIRPEVFGDLKPMKNDTAA